MNENITSKSIKLLIKEIKNKKYMKNSKFDFVLTNYLLDQITNDLKNIINYIEIFDKEMYRIRNENIDLSNKLCKTEIELYNLKKKVNF